MEQAQESGVEGPTEHSQHVAAQKEQRQRGKQSEAKMQ